jgi:hypothetical protein
MSSLSEIYYNPKLGLRSSAQLYRKAKEAGLPVTVKQVKEFVKKQETHQVFSNVKSKALPLFIYHYLPLNLFRECN